MTSSRWRTSTRTQANEASARVAERLGATPDGNIENRYGTATVFRHLDPAAFDL